MLVNLSERKGEDMLLYTECWHLLQYLPYCIKVFVIS